MSRNPRTPSLLPLGLILLFGQYRSSSLSQPKPFTHILHSTRWSIFTDGSRNELTSSVSTSMNSQNSYLYLKSVIPFHKVYVVLPILSSSTFYKRPKTVKVLYSLEFFLPKSSPHFDFSSININSELLFHFFISVVYLRIKFLKSPLFRSYTPDESIFTSILDLLLKLNPTYPLLKSMSHKK